MKQNNNRSCRLPGMIATVLSMGAALCAGAEPDWQEELADAAEAGNAAEVRRLLEQGADVNAGGEYTPFALALREKHMPVLQVLLQYGANPFSCGVCPAEIRTELLAMIQVESSLRYAAEILNSGDRVIREELYGDNVEYLRRCEPENYKKLVTPHEDIARTLEACRRWQNAVKAFLDAWWAKELAGKDGLMEHRVKSMCVIADTVQKDVRELAAVSCWYPSYTMLSHGISDTGYHYDFFRLPPGAPLTVRKVFEPGLHRVVSKFESAGFISAALEEWKICHFRQRETLRRELLKDEEVVRLFDAASDAYLAYFEQMQKMCVAYCRCTYGGEFEMLAIQMLSRADAWLNHLRDISTPYR